MTVHCTGESGLLEQVGEKQDFECELTSQGFRHEDFELRVRRVTGRGWSVAWSCDYSVTVARPDHDVRRVYIGGPAHGWVGRFAADLARGLYDRRRREGNGVPIAISPPRRGGSAHERGSP